ncbi:unnamed protein product [Aphis gossypii]|uniref:Uncharacterized protein n=1 Tax=Aphis gossypii TaxID=80765 RepID=A0A9P0IZ53_APHGO|nr:unnamed protein product [Aphis gossypii]
MPAAGHGDGAGRTHRVPVCGNKKKNKKCMNSRTGCRKTGPADGRFARVFRRPACSGLPRASFGFFDDTLANVRCGGATIILYSVGGLSRGCYGRQQRGRHRNYIGTRSYLPLYPPPPVPRQPVDTHARARRSAPFRIIYYIIRRCFFLFFYYLLIIVIIIPN